MDHSQVIGWDRGRLARKRAVRRADLGSRPPNPFSRFALIAGGTPAFPANHLIGLNRRFQTDPSVFPVAYCSLWYNPTCTSGFPVNENIVMLKRLSEAISQSNIESYPLASETHGSHHSSCNFNPNLIAELSGSCLLAARAFVNCLTGGQEPSRT